MDRLPEVENDPADPCTDKWWANLLRFEMVLFLVEMSEDVEKAVEEFFAYMYGSGGMPEFCNCVDKPGNLKCTSKDVCIAMERNICCPNSCSPTCQNRRFNGRWRGYVQDLALFPKKNYIGVACMKGIPRHSYICELSGVLRKGKPYKGQPYAMPVDNGFDTHFYLDFEKKGNLTRFLRRATAKRPANCIVETWWSERKFKLILKAGGQDIPPRTILRVNFPQFSDSENYPDQDLEYSLQTFGDLTISKSIVGTEYGKRISAMEKALARHSSIPKMEMKDTKKTPKKTSKTTPKKKKISKKLSNASMQSQNGSSPDEAVPKLTRPDSESTPAYIEKWEDKKAPVIPAYRPKPSSLYLSEVEE